MPKNVEYYLSKESPEVALPVAGFYQFARSKRLAIDDLDEHSWPVAVRALVAYEKYGSGEKHHETLIGYYNDWKAMRESENL